MHLVPQILCLLPRGHPLITWLLWPGACVPGSHDTIIIIIETVLDRLLAPAHYRDSSETPFHSIYERGLFSCPGASACGTDFRFGAHLGA